MHRSGHKIAFPGGIFAFLLCFVATLAACERSETETAPVEASPLTAVVDEAPSTCGESGALQAALFGSIKTDLDWSATDMTCESMRRPDGAGMRLRFTGDVGGERLALIIALPGLTSAASRGEIPSVVTTTVEDSGRFFSTPNLDACWADISGQEPLTGETYQISGTLNCIAPLGELNGGSSVSIPELTFTGIVDWGDS